MRDLLEYVPGQTVVTGYIFVDNTQTVVPGTHSTRVQEAHFHSLRTVTKYYTLGLL